jgi:hypothetical protein
MTIESQLERICVALELIAKSALNLGAHTAVEKGYPTTKVTEAKKEEPKVEPETTNKASFDDLADKVKALGRTNRDAVVSLFKQFGIERLGGLEEKDYIAFDIAIAKALNKANEG